MMGAFLPEHDLSKRAEERYRSITIGKQPEPPRNPGGRQLDKHRCFGSAIELLEQVCCRTPSECVPETGRRTSAQPRKERFHCFVRGAKSPEQELRTKNLPIS